MASYRSARFGRFDIDDGAALRFPDGVAGLAHLEWFAILKRRADSVFLWLQSLDDPDVALPIVLPVGVPLGLRDRAARTRICARSA